MKLLRPLIPTACLQLMFMSLFVPAQWEHVMQKWGTSDVLMTELVKNLVVVGVAGLIFTIPAGLLLYGLTHYLYRAHPQLRDRVSWRGLIVSAVALAFAIALGRLVNWWVALPFFAMFGIAIVKFKIDAFVLMMERFRELEQSRQR
jgi:small-conductance mechanosensitive channel